MPNLLILSFATAAYAASCDIFAASGTPCVAAHSIVRALFSSYNGPLYAVQRSSDNTTTSIGVKTAGGIVDASAQDSFCAGTHCVITQIFDQSTMGNHLAPSPPGGAWNRAGLPVNASRAPTSIAGQKAYSAYFENHNGYRRDDTNGVCKGNDPCTYYMVTSGTHVNDGCCFDYGNAESNNHDDGAGTMEAVYFGTCKIWGRGDGEVGPWVMADLENGLWAGNVTPTLGNKPLTYPFVTAMVKGGSNGFAIKAADATQGKLQLMFDGPRPRGYQPMKKQGSIILGIGGDNSASAIGTFFEGAITQGYTTDDADDQLQEDIVSAKYGQ